MKTHISVILKAPCVSRNMLGDVLEVLQAHQGRYLTVTHISLEGDNILQINTEYDPAQPTPALQAAHGHLQGIFIGYFEARDIECQLRIE
jgi:hypothetical protein